MKWFTPEVEIDLCGHATLATSHVLMEELGLFSEGIIYETRSGRLTVNKNDEMYSLNFPSRPPALMDIPEVIGKGIGGKPIEVLKSRDYFFCPGKLCL